MDTIRRGAFNSVHLLGRKDDDRAPAFTAGVVTIDPFVRHLLAEKLEAAVLTLDHSVGPFRNTIYAFLEEKG